jgi:hypothetical protein
MSAVHPPTDAKTRFSVIGQPRPKIDAWAKVTGVTRLFRPSQA